MAQRRLSLGYRKKTAIADNPTEIAQTSMETSMPDTKAWSANSVS